MPTMTAELDELENALTALFRWGNLPKVTERFMARAGVRLDRAAYGVLGRLDRSGRMRLSELAEELGVDVSTASRQVYRLERDGLVRRRAHPGDRRAALLELTPEGRRALARVHRARRAIIGELFSGWPVEDKRTLARLLDRLARELREFAGGRQ
jgi:DNA-binding MarR family transcriptional regulator